jgi:hypothetical protein
MVKVEIVFNENVRNTEKYKELRKAHCLLSEENFYKHFDV